MTTRSMTVSVENLGGIRSHELTLERGVSILTGRNATNRTSLLRAIGAALGGSAGELKADADAGSVTLAFDGAAHTRTFERDGQSVHTGGDPYTDATEVVDQYSCLLADNPAREAVERGDGDALRAFIMAPVDTDEIRATIREAERSIRSLEDDLASARRRADRRSEIESELEAARDELESVRSELAAVREDVAAFEADVDDAQAAETVVEDLKDARDEYERVRDRLDTQRNALDSLREQRDEVEAELAETATPTADRADLEADLERLQRRERDLETAINNLLSIVEFNEELTADGLLPDVEDGDVTDALDPESETVECWTCGTRVERRAVDDRLDDLRDVIEEKRQDRNEIRAEIDDRRSELESLRETADRRRSLEETLDDVAAEIEEREDRIEELAARADDLRDRIETLEARAAESDDLRDSDLLETYQRLSELEYERGQLEEQIDSLEADLDAAREQAERAADIERRIDDHRDELDAARTRIEDLERSAIETFNDQMETVLDLLGYENVERVWIERQVDEGVSEGTFVLHVVRSTAEDVVFEDTVDHLSESEREVIGLVVALAGYLVHDVHERVPVVLLDSLEAIDADRIAALIEHFASFVPFLVVALLSEDAAALPSRYDRIPMEPARA